MPNITLPTPGGDLDTWAPILNTAVTLINNVVDAQGDALPGKLDVAEAPQLIRETIFGPGINETEQITQAEYDALPTPRPSDTLYVVYP